MFTQNQVRQLYVANGYNAAVTGLTNPGDITVETQVNDIYFVFKNADGEIMRTDLVDKCKIKSITCTPAAKMARKTRATYVKLVNDPVGGEDYILNIKINQLNWHSDETYGWKYGVAHATTSDTKSDVYKTLAKSLVANMSRDPQQLLKVYGVVASAATPANVWASTGNYKEIKNDSDISTGDTFYAIVLDEAEQPWKLGTMSQEPVYYEAKSDNIMNQGEEEKWGEETVIDGNTTIGDGKNIADMEWFYHGERGDIYREAAWPNNWADKMLANPSTNYNTLDIHYYWNGANHAVQKSEKDITIAFTDAASGIVAAFVAAASGTVPAATGVTFNPTGNVTSVVLE